MTMPKPEPAIALGMSIGLWIGELLFALQYWLTRPLVICAGLVATAAAGFVALVPHCDINRVAALDVKAIANAIDLYRAEQQRLPDALSDLRPKYLKDLHRDPWMHEYRYTHDARGFAVFSLGPDGAPGGGDDILFQEGLQ